MSQTLEERTLQAMREVAAFNFQTRKPKRILTASYFRGTRTTEEILDSLTGIIPDTGKTLDDYKRERIAERYGFTD